MPRAQQVNVLVGSFSQIEWNAARSMFTPIATKQAFLLEKPKLRAEHREPKPLRPSVTGLCEKRLALAHCDCQS